MLNVVWSRLTGEKHDAMTTHHHADSAYPVAYGRGFRSDFHFAAFGNFFTDFNMVPQEGFEPPTPSLRMTGDQYTLPSISVY
jgi:hypothetical protein